MRSVFEIDVSLSTSLVSLFSTWINSRHREEWRRNFRRSRRLKKFSINHQWVTTTKNSSTEARRKWNSSSRRNYLREIKGFEMIVNCKHMTAIIEKSNWLMAGEIRLQTYLTLWSLKFHSRKWKMSVENMKNCSTVNTPSVENFQHPLCMQITPFHGLFSLQLSKCDRESLIQLPLLNNCCAATLGKVSMIKKIYRLLAFGKL